MRWGKLPILGHPNSSPLSTPCLLCVKTTITQKAMVDYGTINNAEQKIGRGEKRRMPLKVVPEGSSLAFLLHDNEILVEDIAREKHSFLICGIFLSTKVCKDMGVLCCNSI